MTRWLITPNFICKHLCYHGNHVSRSAWTRHGMITSFKVYRGLENSRFQNHKHFPLYCSCGMRSFFTCRQRRKELDSVVCSEERTSHTGRPPLLGARLSVSVRVTVCMMAEEDETLELPPPPSKNTKSAVWEFFR